METAAHGFKPKERVGVVLIHGVGEQGAFEHLESGARDIVRALKAKEPGKRITTTVQTTADAPYRARQQTWRAEGCAPVSIDVKDRNSGDITRIELREVWWADLGEDAGLGNFFRFLWWGCTLWCHRAYRQPHRKGFTRNMFTPRSREQAAPAVAEHDDAPVPAGILDRVQLFFFACLFLLVLPTWFLLGLLFRSLRIPTLPSAGILVRYIGDVKLYGQRRRSDLWPLADLGTPPRFMIRRRFVRAMIDTALGGYDRWYVFGHSLGSVIALNGIMEPGHALPNYLDEERWIRCREKGLTKRLERSAITDVDDMIPARPSWLDDQDAIDRRKVFERFRGLLTYGSPLDKFAVLFPATVPLNRDCYVFPERSEWINIVEPADPVAGQLDFFGPFRNTQSPPNSIRLLTPQNYPIACWPVALWSHITYFVRPFRRLSALAEAVQNWLIYDSTFESAFASTSARKLRPTEVRLRNVSKWMQIVVFAFATLAALAALINWAESLVLGASRDVGGFWMWLLILLVLVPAVVLVLGLAGRAIDSPRQQ